MSVIPENKLSLQETGHLIGIDLLSSGFRDNFGSQSHFPGGKCPFWPPADAHDRSQIIAFTKTGKLFDANYRVVQQRHIDGITPLWLKTTLGE